MTHSGGKPHAVGDKGQRYEVRATGYPRPGDDVIGWSENIEGAERMAAAIRKAPGCSKAWVVDRQRPPFECPECHADLAIAAHAFGCSWPSRQETQGDEK